MGKIKGKKGITMVALVITIVVLLILTAVAIRTIFGDDGLIDKTVRTKFTNNFMEVKELVEIYESSQTMQDIIDANNGEQVKDNMKLPVIAKLTDSELRKIQSNIPTLAETIKELSQVKDIKQANLYWIDLDLIGSKVKHKYLIDIDNMQIFDYEGEKFLKKRWHTLQMGVDESTLSSTVERESEMWDGWITLTLYYPNGATEKMWRLSQEGETRYDDNLTWEDYTGLVTVRLSQVEDIWIKYKINGETKIIPPLGKMLVDIEVSPTGGKQTSVNVKINYDAEAELKQYRINGGVWQNYTEEFVVTENVLIEAKGQKTESVYDTDGNLVTTQKVTGTDSYFIRNIGTEPVNSNLPAPTVKVTDDGKIEITYPENATEKYYKTNYGEEKPYTGPIENLGEIIIDYKTPDGKSEAIIYDSQTSTTRPYIPYEYNTTEIPETTVALAGPTIKVSNSGEQATITVTTAKPSRKIYIKLGNQSYQEYTGPVVVSQNMTIRAYYISYEEGQTSKTSYARVSGLHQGNKPSVVINAEPYPYGNNNITDKVTATITTDATSAEYSFDGVTYKAYTEALKITSNCRLYARATNDYGTTNEYLDITNLSNTAPAKKANLAVSITVTPEPKLSTTLTDNVTVSITYDEKATGKYYSIGKHGKLQEYTEPFKITENCTIYAYATSSNGKGQAVKMIDNITTGISEPIIEGNPQNSQSTAKTRITISFDKNAKTKRYEINGGGLREYTGEFEVEENCTIRAVNTNSLGQSSEATYTVENIVAPVQPIILDKGDYYLLKLPFPENTSGREYKYGKNGIWTSYKEDGIILIKPEKKDKVLSEDEIKIKIEDENGKKIDFKGDWYLIDVPISEVFANITMRWDRTQENSPNIILNTTDPAREVTATIIYPSSIVKKQYKIVYPDGTDTGWKEYKEQLKINKKGTIIYARGIDDAEVYSKEAIKEVTNIDEESPVIKLTADLDTAQQKVGVKVMVTDDTGVNYIKYAKGNLGESYFVSNGTAIVNNSVVNITENGIYTFYAEDQVGNTQIYTLTVSNVDLTPPEIVIESSPDTVGTESTVTIDYGDSTTKQYKIGANTTTWTTYTGPITITSYDVISAGAVNSDYTFTIYAKGKDSAGNEITESQKILNLDLDAPSTPVITSNSGYPVLTEYGVKFDGATTIAFDSRSDITNYYSLDKGDTWNVYNGTFELTGSSTIIAKSVKNATGLETIASKTVSMPSDALEVKAYDGDETTYVSGNGKIERININEDMIGKKIYISKIVSDGNVYVRFYSKSGTLLKEYLYRGQSPARVTSNITLTIPNNSSYMAVQLGSGVSYGNIYEIKIANEPVIKGIQYFPEITEYGIKQGYCTATILYDSTNVQRLYKIGTEEWKEYKGETIRLKLGQTLYAKGINKEGVETRATSSYTATLPSDALEVKAYDGDETTYVSGIGKIERININEDMIGKKIYISKIVSSGDVYVRFYSKSGTLLKEYKYMNQSPARVTSNIVLTIPNNSSYMAVQLGSGVSYGNIYEIKIANEPVIKGIQYFPEITEYGIKQGYCTATILYDSTNVQRLYKIGTEEWKEYKGETIRLKLGQTLYAKGINKEGVETRATSSYTATLPSDALEVKAYDGDETTYVSGIGKIERININEDMIGKKIYISKIVSSGDVYVRFYSKSGTLLKEYKYMNQSPARVTSNIVLTIPNNSSYMAVQLGSGVSYGYIYEIKIANEQ